MIIFDRFLVDTNGLEIFDLETKALVKFESLKSLYHYALKTYINDTTIPVCLRDLHKDAIIDCNTAGLIQTGKSPVGFKSISFVVPHQRQDKANADRSLIQSGMSERGLIVAGWSGPYKALIQENLIWVNNTIISIVKFPKVDDV